MFKTSSSGKGVSKKMTRLDKVQSKNTRLVVYRYSRTSSSRKPKEANQERTSSAKMARGNSRSFAPHNPMLPGLTREARVRNCVKGPCLTTVRTNSRGMPSLCWVRRGERDTKLVNKYFVNDLTLLKSMC